MSFFEELSDSSGLPLVTIKSLVCLFLNLPLSYAHTKLLGHASPFIKHLVNILLGLLFLVFTYGYLGWIHVFITATVSYWMVRLLPKWVAPYVVFVWCIAYLSGMHIYRMITQWLVWEMDLTGPQMLLTIKLTAFAWNCFDGLHPDDQLKKEWVRNKLPQVPSLIEFYGFVFHFGTLLSGPSGEIADYIRYTERDPDTIPPTLLPGLRRFFHSLICLVIHLTLSSFFPSDFVYTQDYADHNILYKYGYSIFAFMGVRSQYYFGWSLGESANILNGYSYNGVDSNGNAKWDLIENVKLVAVEGSQNPYSFAMYWNMSTAKWLRNHVYLRLSKNGKKVPGWGVYFTQAISAFWHGFYPGYYFHFMISSMSVILGREIRKKIRPYFTPIQDGKENLSHPLKLAYDAVTWLVLQASLGYAMGAFCGLSWENTITYYTALHWSGLIVYISTYFILSILPTPKTKTN